MQENTDDVSALHNMISQHAVCSRRQPPEEVEGSRWEPVAEPRMPQLIQPSKEGDHAKRRQVQHDSRDQAESHKDGSSPWIAPAQQGLQPLALCCQVTNKCLHPASDAPQSIIPHPNNILCTRCRESIELLVKLIRVGGLCV